MTDFDDWWPLSEEEIQRSRRNLLPCIALSSIMLILIILAFAL